jgi:hypothetical protein
MAQVNTISGRSLRADQGFQEFVSVDSAANDSDKTFTVPTGQVWVVSNILVTLASTATVGNRQMVAVVSDGTNTLAIQNADSTQAASLTEYYNFSPGYGSAAEAPTYYHTAPLPVGVLQPGWTVRLYDSAAIDAAADDMTVVIVGLVY